jgi:DNA-binding transcriptional LysR family regulator
MRTPKGVELTPVGSALRAQVQRIRLTLDDVKREAADLGQGRAGLLRVASSPAVGEELPAALVALAGEAPDLRLQIVTADNDVSYPMLQKAELDLIFNYITDRPRPGLALEILYDDLTVVCAAAQHRLARMKRVDIAALVPERWAVSSSNLLSTGWLGKAFQERGLPPPTIALEARSVHVRLQAIAASNLLGYLPKRVLDNARSRLGLKELPVKELVWRRPVGVIYRESGYLSPATRRFIDILKTTTREIAGRKQ